MEKLMSKRDTKIVIKEFFECLKEIEISRQQIADLDIFGDSAIDIEVLPNTVFRLHNNIIELICGSDDDANINIIDNLIVGYCNGTIDYEEVWGILVSIMSNKTLTREQLEFLERIRVF